MQKVPESLPGCSTHPREQVEVEMKLEQHRVGGQRSECTYDRGSFSCSGYAVKVGGSVAISLPRHLLRLAVVYSYSTLKPTPKLGQVWGDFGSRLTVIHTSLGLWHVSLTDMHRVLDGSVRGITFQAW